MAENYKFVNYAGAEMAELFNKIADLDVATQSKAGLMSDTDKTKLDALPADAQENVLEGVQLAGTDLEIVGKKVNIPVDNTPTAGSASLIRSGAVATALANAVRLEEYDVSDTEMLAVNLQNKILLVSVSDNSISTAVYLLCGTDDSTNTIVKRIHGFIDGDEPLEFYAGTSGSNNYIAPSAPTNKIMLAWLNGSSEVEVVDRELSDTQRLSFSVGADKDLEAVVGNLATFDENGNPVDSGIRSEKFSEIEGKITDLSQSAGIAEGIADTTSAGTEQNITFRKSGGDGVNWMRRIKGKSLVWNQLVRSCTTKAEVYGITRTKVNNYTIHYSGTSTNTTGFTGTDTNINIISGHKYYVAANGSPSNCPIRTGTGIPSTVSDIRAIVIATQTTNHSSLGIAIPSGTSIDNDVSFVCVDLTLMFGSGNEPSTVDEFRALFPLSYYDYDEGTLVSNDTESLETVGFNQYNPATGTARVIGGQTYYIGGTYTSISKDGETITPVSNLFTPDKTGDVVVVGGNSANTIINLSSSKNGTYEPYWKRTLNLGLNDFKVKDGNNIITVNGLKSAGSVYDEISNGKYIKRIETRAYQSGDESNSAVTTDGTNTNYALSTPVEYELVESIPNAILCDEDGTEQAIFPTHEDGTPSAPLCTDSNYSISVKNLLAKLNE